MNNYKRILVGLDLTQTDESVIRYVRFLADLTNPSHIYFLHIEEDLESELIEGIDKANFLPLDEQQKQTMEEQVESQFSDYKNAEIDFNVIEGDPTHQMLHWAVVKEVDLIVLGRKLGKDGAGLVPEKIARKAPCSVLFVPENSKPEISKIVVSNDFSNHSKLAIENAVGIANTIDKNISVIAQHVFKVPTGYYKTGMSFEEFSDIMKSNAEKKHKDFMKKVNTQGVTVEGAFALEKDKSTANYIFDFAHDQHANLIVVGSQGRTDFSALLLGSLAEKIIKIEHTVPLLIVKKDKENLDFLSALLKL